MRVQFQDSSSRLPWVAQYKFIESRKLRTQPYRVLQWCYRSRILSVHIIDRSFTFPLSSTVNDRQMSTLQWKLSCSYYTELLIPQIEALHKPRPWQTIKISKAPNQLRPPHHKCHTFWSHTWCSYIILPPNSETPFAAFSTQKDGWLVLGTLASVCGWAHISG